MDIELLRTFLEVHRARHFGRAAENLFISQSAVSARIKQLEDTLEVTVLTRERNNIRLTEAGQRLLPHAEKLVSTWTRARQIIGMAEASESALTIGASASVWEAGLKCHVGSLCAAFDDSRLTLESHDTATLVRRLLDRSMDIALMFEPPRLSGLIVRLVDSVDLVLVSSEPAMDLASALNEGYVAVDWPGVQVAALSEHAETLPVPRLRVSLAGVAREYLLAVGGAAYLAEVTVAADLAGGRLHEVAGAPRVQRQYFAVFARESDRQSAIDTVVGILSAPPPSDAA